MRFPPHATLRCVILHGLLTWSALQFAVGSACAAESSSSDEWETTYLQQVLPILQTRCAECHAGEDADGGFDLDQFSAGTQIEQKSDLWSQVGKRLRLGEMPPEGSPELDDAQKALLNQWIEGKPVQDLCSELATDETKSWYRGYVMSRRLTRTEYLNAVCDLVGVPVSDPSLIPSDGSGGEGFDTAGDSLFTSTIHIQRYLSVASALIDEVLLSEHLESGPAEPNALRATLIEQAHQKLIFVRPSEKLSAREAAAEIISDFAHRAWRRPIAAEEIQRLMDLYDFADHRGSDFIAATAECLKAVLVSPYFLFVVETEAPEGGVQRLTQHQLATRLALLIWSSVPDAELLTAADQSRLESNDDVLVQVRRMLADPKSRALGENFGLQWLGLANFLHSTRPDSELFPEFNSQLAVDLREEAVRMVWSVFRDNRSILNLLDSETIEINSNLAKHYGLSSVSSAEEGTDPHWQRMKTSDRRRGGAITLGAVLVASSYPRRTSPVLRGRWILEELLGDRVPPPPPGVPPLSEEEAVNATTLRERLEIHRENPECASCHNRMDPLGFGLENFDALGRWRDREGSSDIDASGVLPSGEGFSGPEELKQILLGRSAEFETNFVRKILGFALGRELNEFDQCVIEDCIEQLAANEHRAASIIETIATSYPFQHRYFKPSQQPETAGQ